MLTAGDLPQNYSSQNATEGNSSVRSRKQSNDSSVDTFKGCGLNMGSYGVHGDLICGEDNKLCPECSSKHSKAKEEKK